METHGIIIIDSSVAPSRITVMHCTHNQDDNKESNIQSARDRYEDSGAGSRYYDWMEFAEPLTLHNL